MKKTELSITGTAINVNYFGMKTYYNTEFKQEQNVLILSLSAVNEQTLANVRVQVQITKGN